LSNQISFFIFTLHGGKVTTRRQWLSLGFTETLWLNARQSKKAHRNFHQMALNDSLAMSSVPKKYFGFLVDEISECGHTIKWRKPNSKYSLYDFRLKASFKPIENI